MNSIILPSHLAFQLHEAAAVIAYTLTNTPFSYVTEVQGTEQALEATMEERDVHLQAIDAFMEERDELKRSVELSDAYAALLEARITVLLKERTMQAIGVDALGSTVATLTEENEALYSGLKKVAQWHNALRERLAPLGITVDTDDLGEPCLTIDLPTLAAGIEGIMGIA